MKKLLWAFGTLMLLLSFRPFVKTPEQPVQELNQKFIDFGLADHKGVFHQLSYYDDHAAVVLFVQGNGCPIVRNAFTDFEAVKKKFADQKVKFLMINSNIQDDRSAIKQEADEFKVQTPILVDDQQLVANMLDIRTTSETFLIDMKSRRLKYRGPISDRLNYETQKQTAGSNHLENAIHALLAGETIMEPARKAVGCKVTRLSDKMPEDLTYVQDVAPILKRKCAHCHQEGGIAPWAMKNYKTILGWSSMIANVINTKRMPPWHADREIGHFSNDLSLTTNEVQTITGWITGDMLRGDGDDPLETIKPNVQEWALGEPDYELEFKPESIPATGIIDYRYQSFKIKVKKDVYVSAVEVQPDKTEVLHHVLATLEYPKGFQIDLDRKRGPWIDGILAAWAPGANPEVFPAGTGRIIPKGSTIHIQLHYTTNGRPQTDQSRIGFHFLDHKPEKEYFTIGPSDFDLAIQPHDAHYRSKIYEKIYEDIRIFGFFPHMHYRGKSMKYTLIDPEGKKQTLISIPNYNFNWQRNYYLDKPLDVRKGSKILVEAVFDNSAQNIFNPNPEEAVYYGEQTFDEMMIGFFSYHKL